MTGGNLAWPLFLAYLFNFPFWGMVWGANEVNIDVKTESMFKADRRFMGPIYAFVFNDWLTWVWCLYVVSGTQPFFLPEDHWLFRSYIHNTVSGWVLFTFVWGYMAGVNGLAGHELIHKREMGHKILGCYTYSKILYSHFLLEHSTGHHRNVATPEDPATARVGENFYSFAVRSAIGGHVNTW